MVEEERTEGKSGRKEEKGRKKRKKSEIERRK